jgi:hypothetical protein
MDYVVFARTLIRGVNAARGLALFMNDAMAPLLQTVSDIHFHAASQALRDREQSNQPERELGIAINHLGTVYQAFCALSYPGVYGDDYPRCMAALSSIAICYKSVEECNLMTQYLDRGEQIMQQWCRECRFLYNHGARWERGIEDGGWIGRMLGLKPYNMHRAYMAKHDAAHGEWNLFNAACRQA